MKMRIPAILVLLLSLFCLKAQTPFMENISVEQGLSQGFVPSICQDDDGFLWFATKNGLNRFDGYHFNVFKNNPFDSLSLNNNEVANIVASGGFIIVFTRHRDFMLFHRQTQRFYTIRNPMMENGEICLGSSQRSKNSFLYYTHDGRILFTYNIKWTADLSETLLADPHVLNIQQFFTITMLCKDTGWIGSGLSPDGNHYWSYTTRAMIIRDIESGKKQEIPLPPLALRESGQLQQCTVLPEIAGATWIYYPGKIVRWDGVRWEMFTLSGYPEAFLQFDRKTGLLWGCKDEWVCSYDLSEKPFRPDPVLTVEVGKPVRSGFTDRSGMLWFGTDALGVVKFNPRTGAFKNFLHGMSVYCQPVHNGKNHVLLSDVRRGDAGQKMVDLKSGVVRNLADAGSEHLPVFNIPATENGYFWWISRDRSGKKAILVRYQPETGKRETIPVPDNIDITYGALKFIEPRQLWIITTQKLVRFDLSSRGFTIYDHNHEPPAEVYAVERSAGGTWWIGTMEGLIKAEPTASGSFTFSRLKAEQGNKNSLPGNSIKSLLADPANPDFLWIGTNGMGMSRLDIKKGSYTHFTESAGVLPDDVVYGILPEVVDGNKSNVHLWISTNKGLTRYNPASGFSQFYIHSDGLQDNEFNTYASFRSSTGELLFGGVNGLTVFNPKDLTANSFPPVIQFTELSVNGVSVKALDSSDILSKDIAFQKEIRLSSSQNNLVIQFAAMDFTAPGRNQFACYLEGAEEPWVHRGFEHSAQYLNLSPGTYTFMVKAAGSHGVWNEEPIALRIIIRAPWYLSWPAYLIYLIVFIIAGYLFNQYQLIQRLKSAEAKRLKNLDQFKTRFYTNITHEFRTPLTVILGITEQMINERKADLHPLTLVKRNGENLLRLVNQILDLTKLESHDLKINYIQGDVLGFLRYISESLHSLANAQNVMLRLSCDQGYIVMDYDPERLLQIVHNLLSNAIKFTPSGGKVTMTASLEGKKLTITVADTGIGIPADDLPYIFDRFFQVKMQESPTDDPSRRSALRAGGTGIGLSLTKELVQAMSGEISVVSPVPGNDSGTAFTVILPVTNKSVMIESGSDRITSSDSTRNSYLPKTHESTAPVVLLIEDNPDVMEYLASCLGRQYRLEYAFNGQAGIEKALEFIPDLIVSDVMMPEKDGFEVCDFLKYDERTSHIPVILLTAKVSIEARIAGLKRGADTYLAKPFHEEELLVWIEQLINRQRMLQARYANLSVINTAEAETPPPENLAQEDAFVIKFRTILETNYSDPDLAVEDIASKIGMSRTQLYRKLGSLTGKTITEHLNALRLEKAKELLITGNLNVSEVAYLVGFNDPKYFGRLFLDAFGMSPSEFASRQ